MSRYLAIVSDTSSGWPSRLGRVIRIFLRGVCMEAAPVAALFVDGDPGLGSSDRIGCLRVLCSIFPSPETGAAA